MRNSSIEFLKILAMLAIILNHCTNAIFLPNNYMPNQDYILNLSLATENWQQLVLSILSYGGSFGNSVFLVSSVWFLLDMPEASSRKVWNYMANIWAVSVIIMIAVIFYRGGGIPEALIIRQLFPTFFANNWYMTTYLILYILHPFLNTVIDHWDQACLLRASLVLLLLYDVRLKTVALIWWIGVYFAVAYMKLYLSEMASNVKINVAALCVGVCGNCGLLVIVNFLGLRIHFFESRLHSFGTSGGNPFILLTAVALFNLVRKVEFRTAIVNRIASCSMLIYIIHANMLLRTFYHPLLWDYIYRVFGYDYLVSWIVLMTIVIFIFSLLTAMLYKHFLQGHVSRCGAVLYDFLSARWRSVEVRLLKLR